MKKIVNALFPWLVLHEVNQQLKEIYIIMSKNQEKIDALTAKVDKIVTEIEALKAQPGAETLDFSALEAAVNTADDLNPDAQETVEGGGGQDESA